MIDPISAVLRMPPHRGRFIILGQAPSFRLPIPLIVPGRTPQSRRAQFRPGACKHVDAMPKDLPDFGSMYSKSGRADVVPILDSAATEIDVEAFKAGVLAKLALAVGKDGDSATARDW